MPLPSYSPVRIDAEPVYVISSSPRKDLSRTPSRTVRTHKPVAPAPRPQPSVSPLTAGLSSATVAMLLVAILLLIKWHQANTAAETEHHRAELSWAFAEDVLHDLKELHTDTSLLEADRKSLLHTLDKTQRTRIALEADLAVWQESHQQIKSESAQALTEWSIFSDQLQQHLGTAESQLQQTSTVLEQERQSSALSIAQLDNEKNMIAEQKAAIEREADALNRKAHDLSNENSSLDSQLSSARSSIGSLESRNSQLCNEVSSQNHTISCLNGTISSLNSRINCLENELSRARSENHSDNEHRHDRR